MKVAHACLVLVVLAPSATASLWGTDGAGAWPFIDPTWGAKTDFPDTASNPRISGTNDDLYVVGSAPPRLFRYDGTSWEDLSTELSGLITDDVHDVLRVSSTEVWVVGGDDASSESVIVLYNGADWNVFKSHAPCAGSATETVRSIARTTNYLWVVTRDGSTSCNVVSFCELPLCSSFSNFSSGTLLDDKITCAGDDLCFLGTTNGDIRTCTQAGCTTSSLSTATTTDIGRFSVFGSSFGVGFAATGSGCIFAIYDGTSWSTTGSSVGGVGRDAFAFSATQGAVSCAGNTYLTVDGTFPGPTPPVNEPTGSTSSLFLGGDGFPFFVPAVDTLAPSEFDSGFVAFFESLGFKTPESKMFLTFALVGIANVSMGAMNRFISPGRTKNIVIAGPGILLGVFCAMVLGLQLWMFIIAVVLGGFTLRGFSSMTNTYHEIKARLAARDEGTAVDAHPIEEAPVEAEPPTEALELEEPEPVEEPALEAAGEDA